MLELYVLKEMRMNVSLQIANLDTALRRTLPSAVNVAIDKLQAEYMALSYAIDLLSNRFNAV